MSNVWLCGPSARDNAGTFPLWRERGYKLCVWRDAVASQVEADHVLTGEWRGAYYAINRCMEWAFANDLECEWTVYAGDDTLPDHRDPNQIAFELGRHFGEQQKVFRDEFIVGGTHNIETGESESFVNRYARMPWSTFGVCQPCGDDWTDSQGRVIERIAGSPFVGREFARRINQGKGVFWEEYLHCGGDEELMCVAQKLGVFWQRPDLVHHHNNWARSNPGERMAINRHPPKFLEYATGPEDWKLYKRVFGARKASGFPGSECLP